MQFRIFTDHKSLEYIMTQRNLSPPQAQWLETLNDFDFSIEHILGTSNILADALLRIYSSDSPGTVQASSEFASDDSANGIPLVVTQILDTFSHPILMDLHAIVVSILLNSLVMYPLHAMVSDLDTTG